MPAKSDARRVRFTVELPCGLEQRLDVLSQRSGQSKTELIRDAVRLLAEMTDLKSEGFTVGGSKTHEDGTREIVRIPLDA